MTLTSHGTHHGLAVSRTVWVLPILLLGRHLMLLMMVVVSSDKTMRMYIRWAKGTNRGSIRSGRRRTLHMMIQRDHCFVLSLSRWTFRHWRRRRGCARNHSALLFFFHNVVAIVRSNLGSLWSANRTVRKAVGVWIPRCISCGHGLVMKEGLIDTSLKDTTAYNTTEDAYCSRKRPAYTTRYYYTRRIDPFCGLCDMSNPPRLGCLIPLLEFVDRKFVNVVDRNVTTSTVLRWKNTR